MKDKGKRQTMILRAIGRKRISTQRELIRELRAGGARVDQSTLSRDLTELGIRKAGGRYRPPRPPQHATETMDYRRGVRCFTTCGPHLVVLKTEIGQAQPVALWIDGQGDSSITATLAGDDVIFIATKTRRAQTVAVRRLTTWFGDKHEH